MRKLFSIFAALTLSVGLWAADYYVPITIDANTLNGDVVMGKNQTKDAVWAAGHAGKGLDDHACFYSNDCSYATDLDHGLPASVNVPNPDGVEVPFSFAWTGSGQFDGFDAIHLVSNGEAVTVDFKGGNAFKGLYFLATAGNVQGSSSPITVTITYLDNTSKVSNFNILDWYYNGTKPTNAIQQFYRWSKNNSADHAGNGPCLYFLSLNDALDPLKPIKSLTFTQANSSMCTAIFAITGILNGCTPQAPQNISGIYEGSTTKITFDAVTKDMDGNTITDEVTYVYDVARDPNFIKMLDGYTNQPLTTTTTDGKVTGTINAKLKGFYIRLRAKNTCGVSLNSAVIVDDEAEFFMVTIPESPDYFVPDYVPDARYLSGDQVTFTAQILSTLGKEFKGWINSHGTSMSTTSQVSFTITQDTTILPNVKSEEREFTLTTGVTGKMGTLNKTYPWLKTTTKPGLAYMSTNNGVHNSDSRDTLIVTPNEGVQYRLKFDYAVSSESGYDKLSIWVNNVMIANEISGAVSGSYDSGETRLTGPTTIVMLYRKDYSGDTGDDRGYIYNIVVRDPNKIYVDFDANGGTCSITSKDFAAAGGAIGELPTPTRDGCSFMGWYDAKEGGTKYSATSLVPEHDLTLYAQWTITIPGDIATAKLVLVAGGTPGINNEGQNIGSTHNGDKMYIYAKVNATETKDYIFSFKSSNATSYAVSCTISVTQGDSPITLDKTTDEVPKTGNWSSYNNTHSFLMKNVAPGPCTICVQLTANGSNYAGNYKDFKVSPVPVYTRNVTDGSWGTICLPWESTKLEGGDFYDVLGTKHAEYGVALVELGESDQLTAGKPYVFKATSSQIKVTYNPATKVDNPVAGNHIIGSFAGCTVPNGMYIIYNNLLYITDGSSTIGANRAYFDADNMEPYNPATAPARVVFMGGRQAPTDNPSLHHSINSSLKVLKDGKYLINGQFVIIKDNKMYNAQGIEIQ